MLDVPTTRVAYVKVTPTISNWIQPIAIGSRSNPPRDVDRTDRDPIAIRSRSDRDPIAIELQVWTALRLDRDRIAIQLPVWTGLKGNNKCGQPFSNLIVKYRNDQIYRYIRPGYLSETSLICLRNSV